MDNVETWIVVQGWDARERLRFSRWEGGKAFQTMQMWDEKREVRSGSYVSFKNAKKAALDWTGSLKKPNPRRSGFFAEIWHADLDKGTVTMVEKIEVP